MRLILTGAMTALLLALPLASAQAESTEDKAKGTKYEAAKGLYAQGAFTIAKTNFSGGGNLDPNLGFAFAGGYRFLSWVGADAEFYWAGRDQGGGKTRQFGLTFNGKVYPMGLFAPKTLDSFQPYMVVGMGGGNYKFTNGGTFKNGTFIFRLGAGLDWMITDHIGAFMDLSLHATPGTKNWVAPNGGATGVIQFGGKFNF